MVGSKVDEGDEEVVRAEVNLEITMESISFGVVTNTWGIWDWFIGPKGQAKWKVGKEAPPGCRMGDGTFMTEKEVVWEQLATVDVVLWDGKAPEPDHCFWKKEEIKVMYDLIVAALQTDSTRAITYRLPAQSLLQSLDPKTPKPQNPKTPKPQNP